MLQSFDMTRRLNGNLEDTKLRVFHNLFNVGDEYIKELEQVKAQKAAGPKEGNERKIAAESPRAREPW